jgi:hypothetical protein
MTTANYRKIYEEHYGPIPTDSSNRTYDIHHIDGNRQNNDPSNLIALSVQAHYDIHYAQGDYGACLKIKRDMKLSKEEMSLLATQNNLKKVKEGTHNFLGGQVARETQQRLVAEGKHHWLTGEAQRISTTRRLKEGTHPFQLHWTCQYCGVFGKNKAMYNRWHNQNCKEKTN